MSLMEVEAFFKIADSVKAQAQWDDLVAISVVRSKFRGAAASFWQRSIDLQTVTTYDDFKRMVIDYFKMKLPLAVRMAQFFELRQEKLRHSTAEQGQQSSSSYHNGFGKIHAFGPIH